MTGGGRPLGIIAGGGSLPLETARAATAAGHDVFIAALRGSAVEAEIDAAGLSHAWFGLGQFGGLLGALRQRGIRDVALIGKVVRPGLADVKPDFGVIRHLPTLKSAFGKGDDGLLRVIIGVLESEGLIVHSVVALAPGLAADNAGMVGRHAPSDEAVGLIAQGAATLDALAPFDIGQAVVVVGGRPVAIEGPEGTDQMLVRVAEVKANRRLRNAGGVLVKRPKSGQDLRVDLPTIGPSTVRGAVAAGLHGIAIAARTTLIAEREETIRLSDEAGLFIEALP
jgi:UDP-2,3-diacylglucosamine hydrolase